MENFGILFWGLIFLVIFFLSIIKICDFLISFGKIKRDNDNNDDDDNDKDDGPTLPPPGDDGSKKTIDIEGVLELENGRKREPALKG